MEQMIGLKDEYVIPIGRIQIFWKVPLCFHLMIVSMTKVTETLKTDSKSNRIPG